MVDSILVFVLLSVIINYFSIELNNIGSNDWKIMNDCSSMQICGLEKCLGKNVTISQHCCLLIGMGTTQCK